VLLRRVTCGRGTSLGCAGSEFHAFHGTDQIFEGLVELSVAELLDHLPAEVVSLIEGEAHAGGFVAGADAEMLGILADQNQEAVGVDFAGAFFQPVGEEFFAACLIEFGDLGLFTVGNFGVSFDADFHAAAVPEGLEVFFGLFPNLSGEEFGAVLDQPSLGEVGCRRAEAREEHGEREKRPCRESLSHDSSPEAVECRQSPCIIERSGERNFQSGGSNNPICGEIVEEIPGEIRRSFSIFPELSAVEGGEGDQADEGGRETGGSEARGVGACASLIEAPEQAGDECDGGDHDGGGLQEAALMFENLLEGSVAGKGGDGGRIVQEVEEHRSGEASCGEVENVESDPKRDDGSRVQWMGVEDSEEKGSDQDAGEEAETTGQSATDDPSEDQFFADGGENRENDQHDREGGVGSEKRRGIQSEELVEPFEGRELPDGKLPASFRLKVGPGGDDPHREQEQEGDGKMEWIGEGELAGERFFESEAATVEPDDHDEGEKLFSAEPRGQPGFEQVSFEGLDKVNLQAMNEKENSGDDQPDDQGGNLMNEREAVEPQDRFAEAGDFVPAEEGAAEERESTSDRRGGGSIGRRNFSEGIGGGNGGHARLLNGVEIVSSKG